MASDPRQPCESGELEQERENEEGINEQITAVDNGGSPLLRPSERDHTNLGERGYQLYPHLFILPFSAIVLWKFL